jgi:hypothetical protein
VTVSEFRSIERFSTADTVQQRALAMSLNDDKNDNEEIGCSKEGYSPMVEVGEF